MTCVSASRVALPPLMIYPRKRQVPESFREGAVPGTVFCCSPNGWMNTEIFTEWFKFFISSIPSSRPVLLIMDGHASHMSIGNIELARENGVHLLCIPSHTSHILAPLDIGVFHSFKVNYGKACKKYLTKNAGRIITSEVVASLVGEAWPHSLSILNILSGFKKTGIFPFNPGAISDRMLAPSKSMCKAASKPALKPLSEEKLKLFEKRYEEGFNIPDPEYTEWCKYAHPSPSTSSSNTTRSALSGITNLSDLDAISHSSRSTASTKSLLNDILVVPQNSSESKSRRKPALNSKA